MHQTKVYLNTPPQSLSDSASLSNTGRDSTLEPCHSNAAKFTSNIIAHLVVGLFTRGGCVRIAIPALLSGLLCLVPVVKGEVPTGEIEHNYDVMILGAAEKHSSQINAHLEQLTLHNFDSMSDRVWEIETRARKALQAVGYYRPTIQTRYATEENNTAIQVYVDVGMPVIIDDLSIEITGEAKDSAEFNKILNKLDVSRGKILNHGEYEAAKDQIYSHARKLGFFNARFNRSQVLVESKANRANVWIEFDSGDRHVINQVTYNTNLFDREFLTKWQSFKSGVPYRASYAATLTRNLQNSGYFKNVSVKPDLANAQDAQVSLLVDLVPARENIMSLGAGYATDTELRVKGSWLRPHHNPDGHSVQSSASLSRRRQEISFSYRIPHRNRPEHGHYSIDAGLLNNRTDNTFSQLRTVNFIDSRLLSNGWYRDVFVKLENENTEDGDDRSNLFLPGFSLSRTLSDSGLRPEHGNFFSFGVLGGSKRIFSDINLFRVTATAKKLVSWRSKNFLIARTDVGYLQTSDFNRLAPSHRFFTGGDNSVRGYEFQSISPRDSLNERTGGRYLTNFSVEYNRYFRDRWALAAFTDIGRAFNDASERYRVGIGTGIRWLSPVGPLRFDVAVGVTEPDNPVRVHLAIGPQL